MKSSVIKTERMVEEPINRTYQIISYGRFNDAPQRWLEILSSSGTGLSCANRYMQFLNGKGFKDQAFYKSIVNSKGLRADKLLRAHCKDVSRFNGFAFHFNYNALYQKTEINYVPFENIRFHIDNNGNIIGFALHPDWGKRNTGIKPFENTPIKYVDFYNPDPKVINEQVKAKRDGKPGTWENWNGQLLYCSKEGDLQYPAPVYDAIVADISTEDAIATIKNRNSKNAWIPACMLVTKGKQKSDKDTEDTRASEDFKTSLKQFQGAENAGKIIHVEIDFDEEKPEVVPFETRKTDKEFDYSEKSVQQNIGNAFLQPPVLRGQLVAGKLATSSEIKDAYDFYNAITQPDRIWIEENYAEAFIDFMPFTDFSIDPLEYVINTVTEPINPV